MVTIPVSFINGLIYLNGDWWNKINVQQNITGKKKKFYVTDLYYISRHYNKNEHETTFIKWLKPSQIQLSFDSPTHLHKL